MLYIQHISLFPGFTTMIPAMESFCVFAGFGVLMIFLAMISVFIAGFSIDQNRMNQNKNLFCMPQGENWEPNQCSKNGLISRFFEKFAYLIVTVPFKVVIGKKCALKKYDQFSRNNSCFCTMCDFHNFGLIFAGQMHCLPQRLKSKKPFVRKNFKQC